MHLSSNRDLKQYWRLLKKISPNINRNTAQRSISAKDWVNHFKPMFHSENISLPISDGEHLFTNLRWRTSLYQSPMENISLPISDGEHLFTNLRWRTSLYQSPMENISLPISDGEHLFTNLRWRTSLYQSPMERKDHQSPMIMTLQQEK